LSETKFSRLKFILLLATMDEISQEEYEKSFPDALFRAQFMEPTEDDVRDLFDKLDTDNDQVVYGSELFNFYLTFILEEDEINNVIKKFREYDEHSNKKTRNMHITKAVFVEQYPRFFS